MNAKDYESIVKEDKIRWLGLNKSVLKNGLMPEDIKICVKRARKEGSN